MLFFLLSIIGTGIGITIWETKQLEICAMEGKAFVIKKYTVRSRGYRIQYKYIVKGKTYKTTESLNNKLEVEEIFPGSTLDIKYSCNYPNTSRFSYTSRKNR